MKGGTVFDLQDVYLIFMVVKATHVTCSKLKLIMLVACGLHAGPIKGSSTETENTGLLILAGLLQ